MNEKCLYVILLQEIFLKSVELTSMLSRAYLIQTQSVLSILLWRKLWEGQLESTGTDIHPLEGRKDGYNFYALLTVHLDISM